MKPTGWAAVPLAGALGLLPVAGAAAPDREQAADAAEETGADGSIQSGIDALAARLTTAMDEQELTGFYRVAVLPFEAVDDEAKSHELGRVSSELLSSRLARRPNVLQVERSRLDAIVEELDRSKRGELDPDGAASVGRLLGANSVVLGSVAAAGADYLVTARLVDTETGRIVTAADQSFPRAGMIAFSEDVVVVKTRLGATIRSAVVPGWGQFYNGDTGRGIVYASAFGLTAAGAITSAVLGMQAENDYTSNRPDTVGRRDDANAHYDRTNLLLIGMGAIWTIAVADAWINGEDARTIELEAAPGGAGIGARF